MNKNELIGTITKYIDDTFNELDSVKKNIVSEKQKLIDLTIEYSNTSNDISKLRKNLEDDINNFKREKDLFDEDKENFKNEVIKFNEKKTLVEKELQGKINLRQKINEEIDVLFKTLQSYTTQIKAKETLSDELKSITKLVVDKSHELKKLNEDCIDVEKSMKQLKIDTIKELKSINEDIEVKKKAVVPTMEVLDNREKILKEREASINTIIERYKKLYADKGVGFKV